MQAAGPARAPPGRHERAHTPRHVGMCAQITPPSDPPGPVRSLCFASATGSSRQDVSVEPDKEAFFTSKHGIATSSFLGSRERDRKGHAYCLCTQSKLPSMRVARGRGTATVATSHDESFSLLQQRYVRAAVIFTNHRALRNTNPCISQYKCSFLSAVTSRMDLLHRPRTDLDRTHYQLLAKR